MNLYNYLNGDPLNATDPSGTQSVPYGGGMGSWWANKEAAEQGKYTPEQLAGMTKVLGAQAGLVGAAYVGAYATGAYALEGLAVGEFGVGLGLAEFSGASGVGTGALYAQKTFGESFSKFGQKLYSRMSGASIKTIDDLAGAINAGSINASELAVETVTRNGQQYILNTRTGQALERAGVPRSQWKTIDGTGSAGAESRLTGQLERNRLKPPEGCIAPCSTGGN